MKKTLNTSGMHCTSCEILLEKELNKIKGVKVNNISHKTGIVDLDIKDESVMNKIKKTIQSLGYFVGKKRKKTNPVGTVKAKTSAWWGQIFVITLFWIIVFVSLEKINIFQYFTGLNNETNLIIALLMGVAASLSTCLAITGSIVLGFAEYIDDSKDTQGHLKTQLSFQIGRILGFFILGGLLGIVGKAITIGVGVSIVFTILIGLLLIYMGLHMLGLVSSITSYGLHLPKSWGKKISTVRNPAFAPIIGALTFFLPCGFTQSMQILAINSSNFLVGGLIMATFALGTAPVLFGIGMGGNYIKEHKKSLIGNAIGVLIVFFGLYSINNSYALLNTLAPAYLQTKSTVCTEGVDNCKITENTNEGTDSNISEEINFEKIEITHNGWNMEPETTTLEAGKNYEIIINPTSNGKGCMSTLVSKFDNKIYRIIKDQPIIYKIENIKAGKYDFVCSAMGMHQGTIIFK